MMRASSIAIVAFAMLAGCASDSSLVLLPSENGAHGAVAVLESGGKAQETVVAEPNSRTGLGRPHTTTKSFDPKQLTAQERGLLATLPPPPVRFILYFTEGTTTLTAESKPLIDMLEGEIKDRPGPEVQVTGYTDTVGTVEYNDVLSQKRAEEILAALTQMGIDRSIMNAVGRGKRTLRVQTADNVAEPANRRVEVIVR